MKCTNTLSLILFISLASIFFSSSLVQAKENKALTIVYSGNTYGKAKPCPT